MKKMLEKIVFFGSGPVAEASLEFLVNHFEIEAVITKPTTERAMSTAAPGAPIYSAVSRQALNSLMQSQSFKSRLGIVVDFGIIMEQRIIDSFEFGIVNSHFSLLPQWRGADPISFAILSGQSETGVSLMLIVKKLDEGDLIAQESLRISPVVTGPELTEALVNLSNMMLVKHLPVYLTGQIKPFPQDPNQSPTYSHKLQKSDGIIDWHKPATQIEREIRAFSDWPRSRTKLAGYDLIITQARIVDQSADTGSYHVSKDKLVVYCGEQALEILRLQPAGKKEMPIQAFLAGYKL